MYDSDAERLVDIGRAAGMQLAAQSAGLSSVHQTSVDNGSASANETARRTGDAAGVGASVVPAERGILPADGAAVADGGEAESRGTSSLRQTHPNFACLRRRQLRSPILTDSRRVSGSIESSAYRCVANSGKCAHPVS
jgi:hypothetical protein